MNENARDVWPARPLDSRRLDSWKEIAAYLGRDVRTAQRWERRDGLPIHRLHHDKLGSVFAYTSELEAWRETRDRPPSSPLATAEVRSWSDHYGARAGVVLVMLAAASGLVLLRRGTAEETPRSEPAAAHAAGRAPVFVRPVEPAAYDSYLAGLWRLPNEPADVAASIDDFAAATTHAPSFGPAYVALSAAYRRSGSTGIGLRPVSEANPHAVRAAMSAVALDPGSARAHSALADAFREQWRWARAEAEYRRAIELDATDAGTLAGLGHLLTWVGRADDGIALARRARDLEPASVERTTQLAWLLYHARQYDDAIRELRTVLAAKPRAHGALWFLGFALLDSGRLDEAIDTLERLAAIRHRNPAALGLLARAYGVAGRTREALAILDELHRGARSGYVPPAPFVHAYVGLGDRENAFGALERAYREQSHITQMLRTHPLYDPLRGDPRFTELVRRVGLE